MGRIRVGSAEEAWAQDGEGQARRRREVARDARGATHDGQASETQDSWMVVPTGPDQSGLADGANGGARPTTAALHDVEQEEERAAKPPGRQEMVRSHRDPSQRQ